MNARISEIFYSLQGEGLCVGVPQVFVRFWGCNLSCGWCDTPIVPVCQNPKTLAHRLFTRLVIQEEDWLTAYRWYTERKEFSARSKVQVNPGAIGYVGPLYATGRFVKVLSVDGAEYSKENIRSGKYPLSEGIYFVTKGSPKPGTPLDTLITFTVSENGQQIIENKGFTPLKDP